MENELDDLGQIESQGFQNNNLNLSNVYSVRIGGFGTDPKLKTYLTTLKVHELEEDIKFYETLSIDKDWPISQIIQREVDKDRVNSITKKYLLGEGRVVKYFPPIIVALLPRDINGSFAKNFIFNADQSINSKELIFDKSKYRGNPKFKDLLIQKNNDSIVSGLYLYNLSQVFEHNLLCWDQSKFYAVVIDGQHRLEALIRGKNENPDYSEALQDVIFLDVSTLISKHSALTPVEVLRTVFIDINTNAKSVGLVRRILMDDKDLASLCVQSMVESVNKDGNSKALDSFIPSILIDWDGGSLKHELPHVTGVLTLYQIISDELVSNRLITINDHRDERKIKYFIDLLNNYFFVDQIIKKTHPEISTLESSFKEYLTERTISKEIFSQLMQEDSLDSILFNYDYRVLEIAQASFEELYLKAFIKIYNDFIPYLEAVTILKELEAFEPSSTLYQALLKSKKVLASNENYKAAIFKARLELDEKVNKKYFLFYTVVGQKGLFKTFLEIILADFKYGINGDFALDHEKKFISEMNEAIVILTNSEFFLFGQEGIDLSDSLNDRLQDYGTIASSFWEGILYEDGRIVYNTQGVRAISDVLKFVIECIAKAKKKEDTGNLLDFIFRYSLSRTKRLLKKRFGNRTDEEYEENAELILTSKKLFLIQKINEIVG